jgi:predicted dehydrogenase
MNRDDDCAATRGTAMARVYTVGLLGNCCTHGEFVAAALKREPRARIVAAWEDDPRRAPTFSAVAGLDLAASAEAVIADPTVDIVALACSPHEKAGWCELAAQAGKHVFLNKPMCESVESARRIERAVEETGIKLVHDIPVLRFDPIGAKLLDEVRAGRYGRPLSYMSSWGMTFSLDFPIATVWPERLDPLEHTGGGELTNLGCYAIDYMVALFGAPRCVQAKLMRAWQPYADAELESFGQIVADYGNFFAVLAAGKQAIERLPSMDVAEALRPEHWHNLIEMRFEHRNVTAMPFAGALVIDGRPVTREAFLAGYRYRSPFRQLIDAIETGGQPDSGVSVARLGVEVLAAAYRSARDGGATIAFP